MESSLELDDEDEQRSQAAVAGTAANPSNASLGQNKLLALAGGFNAPAAAAPTIPSPSAADAESEARGAIPPLQNKAIQGVAMTVDYSSPSSKTRSLGSKGAKPAEPSASGAGQPSSRASGSGLGLGLGANKGGAGNQAQQAKPQLGLGHKPSSRATASLSAFNAPPANNGQVSTQAGTRTHTCVLTGDSRLTLRLVVPV